jgi:hypothetical protein
VPSTLDALLEGPPVKKLLFMTDPNVVDIQLKPQWQVRTPLRSVNANLPAVNAQSEDWLAKPW